MPSLLPEIKPSIGIKQIYNQGRQINKKTNQMLMKKAIIMILTIASVNAWCELCSDLGDAAAGHIARDFCESDVRTRRVRAPAIRRCRDKVEEEIWNVCKGSPITNHLHTLQDRCDRTVDWIVE